MVINPSATPASARKHRAARQARLTRNSTENVDSTRISLPRGTRNDGNGTFRTSTSLLPETTTIPMPLSAGRAPPTYDELFPSAHAPVPPGPVKGLPSEPKGIDPLVAAMWHNENLSLLLSLPDSLLLKIIGMLSNTGVECIRRVARRFPPLCVREIMNPLRGNNPRVSETGPFNWPTIGTHSYFRPQFLNLIDRDEYCGDCQSARRSRQWEQRLGTLIEYIHCSACGADHPACLFSATQRLKPARLRYCIGHEGFMRVCEHGGGIISLSRLALMKRRRPWPQTRKPWTKILCKDPSHRIPCSRAQGGAFPESKHSCGSWKGLCRGCRWPSIIGHHDGGEHPEVFDIRWAAHIPFNGRMDELRPRIAKIHDNAGKYIVPYSATAKETPELRCFDPNDCHCTTYTGSENVRWEWECGPWLPGTTKCVSDPYKGLNELRPPRPYGPTVSNIIRLLEPKRRRVCAADQKQHQSRIGPIPFNRGVGLCGVDVRPCHTGKDCLKVEYLRVLVGELDGKLTPQWYNTLDPESYNITADEDGLGVFWCPTPGCRNYYKGVLNYAGILRRRDFRKECRHYDCQ